MNQKKIAELFSEHAEVHAQRFADVSAYFSVLDDFIALLPQDATVIDVGSGPGNLAKVLLEKSDIQHYWCIDIANNMLEIAQTIHPNIHTLLADSLLVNSLQQQLPVKNIDGVVCSFCAPYWSNSELEQWLSEIHQLLAPKAILYFVTMGNRYESTGIKTNSYGQQLWMNYYDPSYLNEQFSRAGWTTVKQTSIDDGTQTHELLFILQR